MSRSRRSGLAAIVGSIALFALVLAAVVCHLRRLEQSEQRAIGPDSPKNSAAAHGSRGTRGDSFGEPGSEATAESEVERRPRSASRRDAMFDAIRKRLDGDKDLTGEYRVFGIAGKVRVWRFKFMRYNGSKLVLLGEGSVDSETYEVIHAQPAKQEGETEAQLAEFRNFKVWPDGEGYPGGGWKEEAASCTLDHVLRTKGWLAAKGDPCDYVWLDTRVDRGWSQFAYFRCFPPSAVPYFVELHPFRGYVNPVSLEVDVDPYTE